MVFNGLLITFDIRNIIQWAYLFIEHQLKSCNPLFPQFWDTVCTFKGTKSGIIFAQEQKLKVHWNGIQKIFLLSCYTSKSEQAENSLVLPKY